MPHNGSGLSGDDELSDTHSNETKSGSGRGIDNCFKKPDASEVNEGASGIDDVAKFLKRSDLDGQDDTHDLGEWLDQMCQEHIPRRREYSLLCNACVYLFFNIQPYGDSNVEKIRELTGSDRASPWIRFLKELHVLNSSAERGCALCKLIAAKILRQSQDFEAAKSAKVKFQVRVHMGPASPELYFTYDCHDSLRSLVARSENMSLNLIHGTGQSYLAILASVLAQKNRLRCLPQP